MLGRIGVQHRWDIILGVHRREQHPRHRQYPLAPRFAQTVQPVTDHRVGEFQIAIVNHPVRWQQRRQFLRQHRKLIHSRLTARAMATNHYAGLWFIAHGAAL